MRNCVVCTHKDCPMKGSREILEALEDQLEQENLLYDEIDVQTIDCFSLCRYAPNMAVMPDAVVFSQVTLADVPRIVQWLKGEGPRPTDLEEGPKRVAKRVALERCSLLIEMEA